MYIKRFAEDFLIEWKNRDSRKPLIIRGARQTGKSCLVCEFGKNYFRNTIVLNFEKELQLKEIFERSSEIGKLLSEIEVLKNASIRDEETLLFFDEIQECPSAITKLRYFYEERPQLHIIAAGSLLEFVLERASLSFPVGRVEFYYLFPMNFSEFLGGTGENILLNYLYSIKAGDSIDKPIHEKLRGLLRDFFITGGMPEAVAEYFKTKSYIDCERVWESIIETYREDFKKYSRNVNVDNLSYVFAESPKIVGRQVNISKLGSGEIKFRETKRAMDLLEKAMIIYKVNRIESVSFPFLPSRNRRFKMLFLDLGLVQYANRISKEIINSNNYSTLYKGGFAEQFVGQELMTVLGGKRRFELFYWQKDKPRGTAEIDIVFPYNEHIIPIEVKAGFGAHLFSLHQYINLYKPPYAIRIYDGNLRLDTIEAGLQQGHSSIKYKLLSIPLYAVCNMNRFCEQML